MTMRDWHGSCRCPVCGDPIDYCLGHGSMGDPIGYSILTAHRDGYHGRCNSAGCEERALAVSCTCERPTWVAGVLYVAAEDAESVHYERQAAALPDIVCERCNKPYNPLVSFDPYA